jgi:hypothetical protein
MDLDHTKPYLPMNRGGPPGQTNLSNLGPMTRHHHRAVTHGRWGKRQPQPGLYLFRSPKGYLYLVTNQGTLPLGRTRFAEAIWHAAKGPQRRHRLSSPDVGAGQRQPRRSRSQSPAAVAYQAW